MARPKLGELECEACALTCPESHSQIVILTYPWSACAVPGWCEARQRDGWNCRFSIAPPWRADGHWKELPHHFFNRQSAISPPRRGNENLVFGLRPKAALFDLLP
jgi:hypothetical protein